MTWLLSLALLAGCTYRVGALPRFDGPVVVEQHGPWWIMWQALVYEDVGRHVDVPAGFTTGFASVPRLFWAILPPDDPEYTGASIVHDRLYETCELSRADSDRVFYQAMGVNGTPQWKRLVMYYAVRWFGASAYATGPARRLIRMDAYRAIRDGRL